MKSSYLKGNIICALPQLKDIFFSKSIIYITHHNKDGAVGIVLNYKIMNIKGSELFKKLHIKDNTKNLGYVLYTEYILAFEIAAILLLLGIISAITLTQQKSISNKYQNPSEQVFVFHYTFQS